ncbi:MAG: hypothetical protein IJ558_12805 [Treponema sp.]|nr:hypothetical protein [Treponema sp.]
MLNEFASKLAIRPDLLLVYKKTDDGTVHILYLARISSHTNIFDISKSKK